MHNSPTSSSTALVTGASGGIGYDLASILAKNGHDLILVARNVTALEALAHKLESQYGVRAVVMPVDLTSSASP